MLRYISKVFYHFTNKKLSDLDFQVRTQYLHEVKKVNLLWVHYNVKVPQ